MKNDLSLEDACNAECECSALTYDPVCGSNGIQYLSPCYAGCTSFNETSDGNVSWLIARNTF